MKYPSSQEPVLVDTEINGGITVTVKAQGPGSAQPEPVPRGPEPPRPNVDNSGTSQPLNPTQRPNDQHASTSPQSFEESEESLASLVHLVFGGKPIRQQLAHHLSLVEQLQHWKDIDDFLVWSEPNKTVFTFDEEHIISEEDIETQHAIMNSIKTQHDSNQAKDRLAASRVPPLVWYLAGGTGTPPTREGMKKMVQDMGVWRMGRGHEA
jgi:hypothetical protein